MNSERCGYALVFTDGIRFNDLFGGMPTRRQLRLAFRRPSYIAAVWVSWWCRVFSFGRRTGHVAVAYGVTVLDTTTAGTRLWRYDQYMRRQRGGFICFVPSSRPVNFDPSPYTTVLYPWWLSAAKVFSGGLLRLSLDCVDVAIECLADCGVAVPWHITTPAGLARWLAREGYHFDRITEASATHSGAVG